MKHAVMSAMGLALLVTSVTAPAEANPFKRLKSKAEEIKKEVKDVERAGEAVVVDADFVEANLGELMRSADLSRYVL